MKINGKSLEKSNFSSFSAEGWMKLRSEQYKFEVFMRFFHWRKVCVLYVSLLHTILRILSLSNETTATSSKQWPRPVFLLHVCSAMPSQTKVMQRTWNEATVECQTIHSCHAESTQSNANYMKWGADRMSDGAVCRRNEISDMSHDKESTAGRDNDEDIKLQKDGRSKGGENSES